MASTLGASGNCHTMLTAYMHNVSFGVIGMMLYALFISFLQMNGRDDVLKISLAVMIISNLALDLFFVEVMKSGMGGLGLATSISNILAMVTALFGVLNSEKHKPVVYLHAGNYDFACLPEMAKLGSTQVAFNLAIAFRSFALNILLMKSGGTDAVAVMTVLNMVSCFIGMIPTGIAGTVLMLGSIFNGEKNRRAIEELYVYAMKIAMIMSAVAILLTIIFAPQLAAVFYSSGTLTWSLTIPMLRIFIWFVVFSSVNSIIQKIHQSQGEVLLSNVLSITENLIIVAGAFVLSAAMGTNGVWLAYPVGNIINLGIMFLMIWIGIKRRPGTIADLISVGSRNEVPAENTYTREIPSMEDVVKTSEEIMQFCRERGLGQETCYMSALSVEEMAGNIIRYGFVNKRKHSINVYMIVDNGALTLRVRDDCMMFDPVQYMEQFNQTDKTRNMGIKLVADTAKEMKYQRLIGFNYLTISF